MSKFLHISDLHLREINDSPSAKCELNNLAIKRNILLHLRKIVDKEKVDAVFITGDIDYDETCEFFPFLDDIAKKNVHLFMVFGDHDTQSMRKELSRQYHGSKYVHVLSKTSIIAPNDLSFAVFGLGCLPSQIGYKKAFSNLKPYQGLKPCVFLTHPSSPSYNFLLNLNCRYYGFGHIHYQQIKYLKENVVCGRPGAIFSNWDGDGQTWPMGYIVGILDQNGIKVRFKQWPKRIIQTRRLYIPKRRSVIVIENINEMESNILSKVIPGGWKNKCKFGLYEVIISENKKEAIIAKVLRLFSHDVFVTPSDSIKMRHKYGHNRMVFTGAKLLSNNALFEEFVERSYKAKYTTQ